MSPVVVLTGATGFVGSHVAAALRSLGYTPVGLSRAATARNAPGSVDEWLHWDMSRGGPAPLPKDVFAIVHMAQSSRFREFPDGARDMFDVNVRSTLELLEAARRHNVARFVYVSTGGVYGHKEDAATPPDTPLVANPQLGFYTTSKHISELLVQNYSPIVSTAILRLFFPYGPGQQLDRLMPRLIRSVANDEALKLQGPDGLLINPIFAADAAAVIAAAVGSSGHRISDVAGLEQISLRRLGDMIGQIVGREPRFDVQPTTTRPSLVGNSRRMIDAFGVTPKWDLASGIARTVEAMAIGAPNG